MLQSEQQTYIETSLPFWDKLTSSEKNIVLQNAAFSFYKKGESIHSAEYKCLGREITLYRIQEGELCVLSASCVLQSITFDVYIDAVTDCELLQISSSAIALLMHDNIYVEAFAYRAITERFSDVMWAMQQILFMSFDRRLAIFLLDESASLKSDELHMTHEEIARLMGSAREVVTRMLKYFSSEGYVELSRGMVKLTNKAALRRLC